jgi:mercuric ion transport protein
METTGNTKTPSPARIAATYFMGALAILSCPCHLPILLVLLSGTAAGTFLADNVSLAALILLPMFLLSAIATWRLLRSNDDSAERPDDDDRRRTDSAHTRVSVR